MNDLTYDEKAVLVKTLTGIWMGIKPCQNDYLLMGRYDPYSREVKTLERKGLLRKGEESGRHGRCHYHATQAAMAAAGFEGELPG